MICPSCHAENDDSAEVCFTCAKPFVYPITITKGSVIAGRYEILSPLGKGGMGMVYKAHDHILDETVALKTLRSEIAREPELARRFRSETKLARKVRHKNVCGIHEYGEDAGLRYIAMEYIDGIDLRRVLKEKGAFEPREAFAVALQIARGLQAIHQVGVIHRDLKTPNIMRDAQGQVRLMDFGIAKQSGSDTTLGGQVVGTPEYMSPEQARGHRVDFRSDIYALGIVIYEIFTGSVPFRGDTPIATILMHLHDAPPLDGTNAQAIPGPLVHVLRKALAKEPADRYDSAREMVRSLEGAFGECFPGEAATDVATSGSPTAAFQALLDDPDSPARHTPTPISAGSPGGSEEVTIQQPTPAPNPPPLQPAPRPSLAVEPAPTRHVSRAAPPAASASGLPLMMTIALAVIAILATAVVVLFRDRVRPETTRSSAPPIVTATETTPLSSPAPPAAVPTQPPPAPAPSPTPVSTAPSGGRPSAGPPAIPVPPKPLPSPRLAETSTTPSPTLEPVRPTPPPPTPAPPTPAPTTAATPAPTARPNAPVPATASAGAPAVRRGDLVEEGPGVVPPQVVRLAEPVYPSLARRLKRQARVLVRVLVDENGKVTKAEVVQGDKSNLGFNEAALEAAYKTTFTTATKQGIPVKMWVEIPVGFAP